MQPLVSAIISTYNSEKFIKGKIEDLLSQSIIANIEIVIINSGSQQDEERIIKEYLDDHKNIKYFRTDQRETIYKAWNRGIKMSSGKFITNSNTDDRLRVDALEILSNALEKAPEVGLVYGDQYITATENEPFNLSSAKALFRRKNYSRELLLAEYLPGSQSMWRSDLHTKYDIYFNEEYEVAGDYDFVLRAAEIYKFQRINEVLGNYFRSPSLGNKEFQDVSRTIGETKKIKSIYRKRYIDSLTESEKKNLLGKASKINMIPSKAITLYKKTLDLLNDRNGFPQKEFWLEIEGYLRESLND